MADNLQQNINKTGKYCESQGEFSRRIEQNGGISGDRREVDALLEKLQSVPTLRNKLLKYLTDKGRALLKINNGQWRM